MGGSVNRDNHSSYNTPNTQQASQKQSANKVPLFGGPEDYAHLSTDEKKELTNKMMAKHKAWAGTKPTGGKGCRIN